MASAGEHSDALRITQTAVESPSLVATGTIPGVVVLAALGRCGPGRGRLISSGPTGNLLSWRAPGSATAGVPVDVSGGGEFLLEDGDDRDAGLRVEVFPAYLIGAGAAAVVTLKDRFANEMGHDDVTEEEAAAGDIEAYTVTLTNVSGMTLERVKVWLDAAVTGLEISANGTDWSAPTTEETAVALANIAPEADATLHVRRTIAPGADADPSVLNVLRVAFDGL